MLGNSGWMRKTQVSGRVGRDAAARYSREPASVAIEIRLAFPPRESTNLARSSNAFRAIRLRS
ncbi:hypothetical protein RESH_06069 [Rhodopirellula europaea SH398]|uniref:Uncharacterized protein n=1 Tax=Rhodopirellula europaea SH398 TaxID=1263868 RepID=M5RW23_9BACT|nr:hypothetical protein RESH_06069 [Rhodopirellula europaea SH398]